MDVVLSREMIVRLIVLPLLAGAASVGAAPPDRTPPRAADSALATAGATTVPANDCQTFRHASPSGAPAESRKLGELPPGDLVLTVYRTENGCPAPLIVRKGIGGFGDAAAGPPIVPRRW